jgi:DNA repair protein RadD
MPLDMKDGGRAPPGHKRGRRPEGNETALLKATYGTNSQAGYNPRATSAQDTLTIELRPYQADLVELLRESYRAGRHAPLLQLPTGGGKTIIFCEVARGAHARGRSVLVVCHRRELLAQASAKLVLAGVPHGFIAAGFPASPDERVQVGSIQTLARRMETLPVFDLIVFDEAHHCRAAQWRLLINSQPAARYLGVTATPARLDGKGLGVCCGGPFDDLICGPSIADLISDGYLSPAKYFAPKTPLNLAGLRSRGGDWSAADLASRVDNMAITGDAVELYGKHSAHKPAIAFCATVSHAEHVAEQFRLAGYRAASVDGKMPKRKRDSLIAGLGNGEIEVLTSCDLISEGLDVPAVSAVILLRPTKSLVLHMQQIGRGMRPAAGKDALIVLDHANNINRHGRPDFERIWALDGIEGSERAASSVRVCPECSAINPANAETCEACGTEFPRRGGRKEPNQKPGELIELTADRRAAVCSMAYRHIANSRLTRAELQAYAQHHGYKPGWVYYRLLEQQAKGSA